MPDITVAQLFIYPIKSCRGIEVSSADLVATGFRHDRHWMLVDSDGKFLSQRSHPHMTLINTRLNDNSLICEYHDQRIDIPFESSNASTRDVTIWHDQCRAAIVSAEASQWFSIILGITCDLVFLPGNEHRLVDPEYATAQQRVGFADGFPLLVTSAASMQQLNQKLGEALSIERFRPNIVLAGCEAHAEDTWQSVKIGEITLDLVKPCSRCVIPSIDPDNASKHTRIQRTLADYRRIDGKIMFGMNALHNQRGTLKVGMAVEPTTR